MHINQDRLEEVLQTITNLKDSTIEYSNDIVRQVIECIRVMPSRVIEITFKGGTKKTIPLPDIDTDSESHKESNT